jgi:NitT/TauT family transport system permease protein
MRWAWGALGVAIFVAAWETAHRIWGPFVLPSLGETGRAIGDLVMSGQAGPAVLSTAKQALAGWFLGAATGFVLGVFGGYAVAAGATLTPIAIIFLGVPPIVWVVLALLWFGPGTIEPAFTVLVTVFPIVFFAALHGVKARDPLLDEMARVYGASIKMRISDLILPQLMDYVLPALATALAFSWKVAIMAEVLGGGTGIGGKLETARSNLDLAQTMAWIAIVLTFVLISDGLLLLAFQRRNGAHSPTKHSSNH